MTKIQISKLKVLDFEIGILNLFVICDLLFGISVLRTAVWASALSLAATYAILISFFSSWY